MTLRPRGKKGFLEGYFRHDGKRYRIQTGTANQVDDHDQIVSAVHETGFEGVRIELIVLFSQ